MKFTAIHISDIHPHDMTSSKSAYRDEIIKKLKKEKITDADCLVISGDLFHRGSLGKKEETENKTFINKLPGGKCTIVVPGNHDLDRMARIRQKEGYNTFHDRKTIVRKMGDSVGNTGEFVSSDEEKTVLYKESFGPFFDFSKIMGFKSFCEIPKEEEQTKYELQQFDVPFSEDQNKKTRFVLINTALIAGQTMTEDEYLDKIKSKELEYQTAVNQGNTIKQAEVRLEIEKLKLKYIREDGIIVDNDPFNNPSKKAGRLSLSKDGNIALGTVNSIDGLKPEEEIVTTIFVGHHGYQFLSSETREALKKAMKNCNSSIYLCGHAHRAHYNHFDIQDTGKPRFIEQFQAGVMFRDDDAHYAQYGFNLIELDVNDTKATCKVTSYFLDKSISEDIKWFVDATDVLSVNLP